MRFFLVASYIPGVMIVWVNSCIKIGRQVIALNWLRNVRVPNVDSLFQLTVSIGLNLPRLGIATAGPVMRSTWRFRYARVKDTN
jgi:hypothetical protein